MNSQIAINESPSKQILRFGAVASIVGTIIYIATSILHGNPPIDDAAKILDHVAERPWWRVTHLANIFAVLLWLASLTILSGSIQHQNARSLARISQAMMTCASAVFIIYFHIHGFGFSTLANRWLEVTSLGREALLIETNAILTMLGVTAFIGQAMLGLSIFLFGFTVALSQNFSKWLGWSGVVAGAGWMIGALFISFEIIVPFTALSWIWMILMGVFMWRWGNEIERRK